jgi:hypothetical protein
MPRNDIQVGLAAAVATRGLENLVVTERIATIAGRIDIDFAERLSSKKGSAPRLGQY